MTQKFHIDKNGKPAPCHATKRPCPLGGEEVHFDSMEDAQAYADKMNEQEFGLLGQQSLQDSPWREEMNKMEELFEVYEEEVRQLGDPFETSEKKNKLVKEMFEMERNSPREDYKKLEDGSSVKIRAPRYALGFTDNKYYRALKKENWTVFIEGEDSHVIEGEYNTYDEALEAAEEAYQSEVKHYNNEKSIRSIVENVSDDNLYNARKEYFSKNRDVSDSFDDFYDKVYHDIEVVEKISKRHKNPSDIADSITWDLFVTASGREMAEYTSLLKPAFKDNKQFEGVIRELYYHPGMENRRRKDYK